jgi:hypothetical protein
MTDDGERHWNAPPYQSFDARPHPGRERDPDEAQGKNDPELPGRERTDDDAAGGEREHGRSSREAHAVLIPNRLPRELKSASPR